MPLNPLPQLKSSAPTCRPLRSAAGYFSAKEVQAGANRRIRNEAQYRITKAQAEKFAQALVRIEQAPGEQALERDALMHPLLRKAQRDALRSQLESLQGEITAYENLR